MATNRGYDVRQCRLSIAVDLRGRLKGHAELTLVPTSATLRTVWLNARHSLAVTACSVSGHGAVDYSHVDPLAPETGVFRPTVAHAGLATAYPELKRKLFAAENEADGGELAIGIPEALVRPVDSGVEPPLPPVEGEAPPPAPPVEFEPIVLTVEYSLAQPDRGAADGIRFVNPDGLGFVRSRCIWPR